jgi:hypothetical protein
MKMLVKPLLDDAFELGLSLVAAKTLVRRFEQNAVVWTGRDGVPELLMC